MTKKEENNEEEDCHRNDKENFEDVRYWSTKFASRLFTCMKFSSCVKKMISLSKKSDDSYQVGKKTPLAFIYTELYQGHPERFLRLNLLPTCENLPTSTCLALAH